MNNIHDKVVHDIVSHLNTETYDVYINPGQEKNAGIGDNYPDVILTEKNGTTVKFIMEVETVETVSQEEALRQWKKYVSEINATFYLVVPISSLKKAKELCQREGINARFTTFSVNGQTINFEFQ
ncbi:MAG: hypothetical protein VZQ58_07500 [Bacteroidales bacterium]|nr:hypothetical protein [Bacteroidales bacterium]